MAKAQIIIYTDGASSGNPGPGGYGIVMQKHGTDYVKEFSEGYRKTTNNRMELLAVIVALEKINKENQVVHVYTDSKYVSDSVEKKWVQNWEKKSFKNKKNADLWIRFLKVYRNHRVSFFWVKGHNNLYGNERCDTLAVQASKKQRLKIDENYEKSTDNRNCSV